MMNQNSIKNKSLISIRRFRLSRELSHITDPRILEPAPVLLLVSLTVLVHIVASIDLGNANLLIRIPIAIISMLPAILAIWLGHIVAKKFENRKIVLVLIAYVIGGAFRGWLLEYELFVVGILAEEANAFRVTSGALIVTACAAIVSYVWSTIRDAQQSLNSIHRESIQLTQVLERMKIEVIEQDVERSLNLLKRITSSLSEVVNYSTASQRNELERLVDQVVRPLSKNLAPLSVQHEMQPIVDPKLSWRGVWKLLDPVRHLPSFRNSIIVLAIVSAAPVRNIYGWATAIELVAWVATTLSISILLIYPFAHRFLNEVKSPTRELMMTIGFVAVAIPAAFATTLALSDTPNPNAYVIPGLITIPIYGWLLTLGNAARDYSRSVETQLVHTRNDLRWALARLNLLSWNKDGLFSRLLHGPIQNSIQVAILRMREGEKSGSSQKIIEGVLKNIDDSIAATIADRKSGKIDLDTLDEALNTWREICDIQLSFDASCRAALIQDPAASAILIDIVLEACSNAIRHGKSTEILVSLRLADHGVLLKIRDNGTWDSSKTSAGLGNEILESCSIWHEITFENDWSELSLELPLDLPSGAMGLAQPKV